MTDILWKGFVEIKEYDAQNRWRKHKFIVMNNECRWYTPDGVLELGILSISSSTEIHVKNIHILIQQGPTELELMLSDEKQKQSLVKALESIITNSSKTYTNFIDQMHVEDEDIHLEHKKNIDLKSPPSRAGPKPLRELISESLPPYVHGASSPSNSTSTSKKGIISTQFPISPTNNNIIQQQNKIMRSLSNRSRSNGNGNSNRNTSISPGPVSTTDTHRGNSVGYSSPSRSVLRRSNITNEEADYNHHMIQTLHTNKNTSNTDRFRSPSYNQHQHQQQQSSSYDIKPSYLTSPSRRPHAAYNNNNNETTISFNNNNNNRINNRNENRNRTSNNDDSRYYNKHEHQQHHQTSTSNRDGRQGGFEIPFANFFHSFSNTIEGNDKSTRSSNNNGSNNSYSNRNLLHTTTSSPTSHNDESSCESSSYIHYDNNNDEDDSSTNNIKKSTKKSDFHCLEIINNRIYFRSCSDMTSKQLLFLILFIYLIFAFIFTFYSIIGSSQSTPASFPTVLTGLLMEIFAVMLYIVIQHRPSIMGLCTMIGMSFGMIFIVFMASVFWSSFSNCELNYNYIPGFRCTDKSTMVKLSVLSDILFIIQVIITLFLIKFRLTLIAERAPIDLFEPFIDWF